MEKGQTCVCCRVIFAKADMHREHYKSDWHRYNLKRKVASLPPISAETFQERVLAHRQAEAEAEVQASEMRCVPCGKNFRGQETFQNHLKSKKHIETSAKHPATDAVIESVEDVESETEEDWEDAEGEGLGEEECLFCSKISSSLETNLTHMSVAHGFFIPDANFCTEPRELILYLGCKVGLGNVCLWCNERGKRFHSLDAVQKHMRDKGHCKIAHQSQDMLEYSDFYDFTESYPDHKEGEEESMEVDAPILEERGWELVLPSGGSVGHRALQRYFKQNLKPEKSLALSGSRNTAVMKNVLNKYKALGWTGTSGDAAVKKAKDLAFMGRLRQKQYMALGIRGNKVNQMHFRAAC